MDILKASPDSQVETIKFNDEDIEALKTFAGNLACIELPVGSQRTGQIQRLASHSYLLAEWMQEQEDGQLAPSSKDEEEFYFTIRRNHHIFESLKDSFEL